MAKNHVLGQMSWGPLKQGQVLTSFEVMLVCAANARMCHLDIGFICTKLTVSSVSDNGGILGPTKHGEVDRLVRLHDVRKFRTM